MTIGIKNLGNTCYVNSTIQCLYACSLFVNFILSINVNNNVINNLKDIFFKILESSNNKGTLKPFSFIKNISFESKNYYNNCNECDVHEFLTWLFDIINESYKKTYIFTAINENIIICNLCTKSKSCYEPFTSLSLCIQDTDKEINIQQLIEREYEHEYINKRKCDFCNMYHSGEIKKQLFKAPKILCICLKNYNKKDIIDISAFVRLNNKQYELKSCCCHFGNEENGHYISIVFKNDGIILLNDEKVYYINKAEFNRIKKNIYILFYEVHS